ncbi:carboxylesterase 11 [Populus alba x Populus x berolinensis]|nr:carboxylesterase 11 [Populus alba x Populus x berolinensis]
MPSLMVKLYSVIFKYQQKHLLQGLIETPESNKSNPFGITSRPHESIAASNPSFTDGVATKDIRANPYSSLSLRIFLPDTAVTSSLASNYQIPNYGGYSPVEGRSHRKLPVMLQFHGGGFVSGSNESMGNDAFCRRIAKLCDVIVVAVGYRLAPETKYPGAFEDGFKVLNWLAKQSNLAVCGRLGAQNHIFDSFGASMVEPWLAAHGDTSRCVLLGVSSGANIADYVARKAVEDGKRLDPVKVVAQILMFPFFIGRTPTHSEIKLASTYFYDKTMCKLAWKLFLPKEEFNLDHPAANPLVAGRQPPLKCMPPTITVVAEHDLMRDRAIAYSEELRKVNVDAPLLDYKDAVHEFATLDVLLQTPQAQACAEDVSIWVKKSHLNFDENFIHWILKEHYFVSSVSGLLHIFILPRYSAAIVWMLLVLTTKPSSIALLLCKLDPVVKMHISPPCWCQAGNDVLDEGEPQFLPISQAQYIYIFFLNLNNRFIRVYYNCSLSATKFLFLALFT